MGPEGVVGGGWGRFLRVVVYYSLDRFPSKNPGLLFKIFFRDSQPSFSRVEFCL